MWRKKGKGAPETDEPEESEYENEDDWRGETDEDETDETGEDETDETDEDETDEDEIDGTGAAYEDGPGHRAAWFFGRRGPKFAPDPEDEYEDEHGGSAEDGYGEEDEEEDGYREEGKARLPAAAKAPKAPRVSFRAFAIRFVQSATARKAIVTLSIAGVLLVAQMYFLPAIGLGQERDMRMAPTEYGVTFAHDVHPQFHSHDSMFYFFVTREGISLRASNDAIAWHHLFSFNRPLMSARGGFVAVAEAERGRVIHVFSEDGHIFTTSFENPILSFTINAAGILTAIVQYEGGYGVYVLDRHQPSSLTPIFNWSVFRHERDMIHPIMAEVSDDMRYIVIAYADLNTRVRTVVEFRYINQWDAWETEMGLFAAEVYDGLVHVVRFMAGNRLVLKTFDRIICFQVGPGRMQLDEIWDIRLENRIDRIAFHGGTHMVLAVGDRHIGTFGEGDPVGTVQIYNMNGALTGSYQTGRRSTHISAGHNSVIVGADRSFTALDFRGVALWEHITPFDTRDVLFLDDISTILVAGPLRADVYRRRRIRDDELHLFDLGAGF